jgi:hypothetical protein
VLGFDLLREARLDEGYVLLYVDRGEVAMPNVLRLLDGAGLQLETIGLHRPSLDDVRPDELLINEGALKPDRSDCRSGLLCHWNLVCSATLDQSLDELAITEPHKDGFRPQRWDSETNPRSDQVESSHHVHRFDFGPSRLHFETRAVKRDTFVAQATPCARPGRIDDTHSHPTDQID